MKRTLTVVLVLMIAAFISCEEKGPETTCLYGENIPKETLESIVGQANPIIISVVEQDFGKIYETGSENLKAAQNRDQFALALKLFVRTFGKIDYPMLKEAYYMDSKSDEERIYIPCNLGKEGVTDLWGMPANQELAALIYHARTDTEFVRVVVQLEKEQEEWKLRSLSVHPMTIKHRKYEYYGRRAAELREKNMLHAAALYYKTAILLSDVGLNVNEFTVRALQEQMAQIKVDYMPAGEIQIWNVSPDRSYKVYNVDTAYDDKKLLVQVSYMARNFEDKNRLEKQAREIAIFLATKFPEYRDAFDGIRVTAASEKQEEMMSSYHSTILFSELPEVPAADGHDK